MRGFRGQGQFAAVPADEAMGQRGRSFRLRKKAAVKPFDLMKTWWIVIAADMRQQATEEEVVAG